MRGAILLLALMLAACAAQDGGAGSVSVGGTSGAYVSGATGGSWRQGVSVR